VIYGLKDAKQRKGLEKKCRKHGGCLTPGLGPVNPSAICLGQ
jgi:hypothetical protein